MAKQYMHASKMRLFTPILLALASIATAGAQNVAELIHDFSLTSSALLKVPPIVDNKTNTVIFPVYPGTDLTALAPTFSLDDGVTTSPAPGSKIDLCNPVEYCLYSSTSGSELAKWHFSAVEMGTPALPGLYADPNIAVFNGTYYIYSTTDGFPGWGGQVFYVWSSEDLVSWTRGAEPILTLNGTSGNVPWATGNAWAPTIAERDGRYYFYFSGQNPIYDHKTIGVAVADSPDGPFTAQPQAMITNNETVTTGQAIDPAYFLDPATGTHYLFWGNGHALMAELAEDMISLKPETTRNVTGLTNFTEASFLVYREPYYHYTYSHGDTSNADYSVGYATSTNVTGPWTHKGTVLSQRPEDGILATGSSATVKVPGTDEWYIAYHRFKIPGGDGNHREVCLDKVKFGEDGLMEVVKPTLEGVLRPVTVS